MSAQGRRVLVIGGETTVGRAIVIGLAEAGADVAIASLTADTKAEFAINSALNELWALGRQGIALAIDSSDAEQVRAAVTRAEAELGPLDLALVVGEGAATEAILPVRTISIGAGSEPEGAARAALAALA